MSSVLTPPSPDPAESAPPSVFSERPVADAEGDLELEATQPDVESEADFGGTDDEDAKEPARNPDDDDEGPRRPMTEFEERVAVALIDNKYHDLVAANRCWRCSQVFATGAHICSYCAAALT